MRPRITPLSGFRRNGLTTGRKTEEEKRLWINSPDKRERICFDPHLADATAPAPAARVASMTNPHNAHGYLRCPEGSGFFAGLLGS